MKEQGKTEKKVERFTILAAGILLLAVLAGVLVIVLTSPKKPKPEPTTAPAQMTDPEPAATETPPPAKTPTPGVTSIRLYAYGRELMVADGFTLYVGDKPVEITAVLEPDVPNAQVGWTFSNQEAASLDVSSDGRTCTITALKPTGRNDITVVCQDVTTSMPVFLWEK